MDKKNTVIGVVLLLAAFASLYFSSRLAPPPPPAPQIGHPTTSSSTGQPGPATSTLPASSPSDATFAAIASEDSSENLVALGNDFIEAHFTDMGGAIKDVAFKKYPAVKGQPEPFVFNRLHADPMLAFTQESFPGLDRAVHYQVVSKTATEVVFRAVFEHRVEVTRRYTIVPNDTPASKGDPYVIRHETTFRNLTEQIVPLPRAALSIGTASIVADSDNGLYLNINYSDGKSFVSIDRSKLQGGGFLGFGATGPVPFVENAVPVVWAGATNQFFTSILTPDEPGVAAIIRRIELPASPPLVTKPTIGVTGAVRFDLKPLPAHGDSSLGMAFYVGPKEYNRLSNSDVFKHDEDKVMKFGTFAFFSHILLTMMTTLHGWIPNWGVAIILTTLIIKIVFLPLTLIAARSAKRMQKIQPELQALRDKYKDNPQKLNQATMELFKARKVNPMGGCIPMLIPLPFFFGMYRMLQSTSELRFAEFLWVKDLSAPDTIAHVAIPLLGNVSINLLPIFLGATMIFQTRLVPQPTVDTEQSRMTAKMMKFMPLFYVFICYSFSCALSLYSTINGLFTIGQQLVVNRMRDPDMIAAGAMEMAKPLKNVTPSKKKPK